ncbi:MAG: SRPBCC family protein [Actinobacteria bacterium]|nr:SRPBCC family protein [Actinomycetota bacterium]
MPEIVERVTVFARPSRVWEALTAWERQSEWVLGTRVYATALEGRAVGGGITAVTGIGPLAFTDTMVITEWSPPSVCRVRHTGRVVRGTAAFEVTADGANRAVVTWSEQIIPPLGRVGEYGWPVARPVVSVALRWSLRRFARWAPTYPG